MSEPQWIEDEITKLVAQHGAVPPPYVAFPGTHPYELCWRMGAGESYMMVFSAWWKRKNDNEGVKMSETERMEYCQKWPPEPVWITWVIELIWDVGEEQLDPGVCDYGQYFERTEAVGLGSGDDCKKAWEGWFDDEGDEDDEDDEKGE
ncbi:hypothetical protein NQ176_g9834 [Zarea fungicola]|uniref:Uncharacterized protein n=1 Tax=Zarea fungicola TaxID=93591 RepID=A0ACC1MJS2_9HYPO|nr:hypothetical protein NQ176_g9834 [Lecanicillium fungicola]